MGIGYFLDRKISLQISSRNILSWVIPEQIFGKNSYDLEYRLFEYSIEQGIDFNSSQVEYVL